MKLKSTGNLILILLVVLTIFFLGCKNKDKINNFNIFDQTSEDIVILADADYSEDIKLRLENLKDESLVPWEIKTDSEKKDVIITSDEANIPEGWDKKTIYSQDLELLPESYSLNFKDKTPGGFNIYFASTDPKLDVIFNSLKDSYSNERPKETSVEFLGDIMLSRTVENKSRKTDNWNWPFLNIKNDITPTDLTIANLESPFSDPPKPFAHNTVFGADTNMVNGLKYAGIDIVCLANNHFGDSGVKGMNLTFQTLKDNEILYFGAGDNNSNSHSPLLKEVNGVKFAFLGYVTSNVTPTSYASTAEKPGLNLMDNETLINDLKEAKQKADYVIVSMHAGTEYTPNPNSEQIEFAHTAIENGADMVYAHHPHVVQAIEIYNDKPIYYSLGNFVFDQEWSQETKEGIVLKIKFVYDKIVSMELMPILIENYGQPQKATSNISDNILERIYTASNEL